MKRMMISAAAFVLLALGVIFLEDASMVQRAAIGGEVAWLIEPGAHVEEGDALVRIVALSGGEAVAARAKERGVVRKTMTTVGAQIRKGDAVAKLGRE